MPQQRDPFLWEVEDVVRGGVDLILRTEPWTGRDQVMFLDEISVVNHGHAGGNVEVGLFQGGHYFALDTVYALALGGWEYGRGMVTILSKWQVYARFFYGAGDGAATCVNGDLCGLHVVGYVLEPYSSP